MPKTALITGITGQDGAYLAEFLLAKGYRVHGIKRRTSLFNTDRIDHLYEEPHVEDRRLILHHGDLTDSSSLVHVLQQVQPDEVYNLGAQSHVAVSFEMPEYTADVDAMGTLRLLEAMRFLKLGDKCRFYQASTSELYGLVQEVPQRETTPFHPRSPYGVAKLYAYWITVNYREAYGMYACNGILFNHESPRRGETFVTRKITRGLANIAVGLENCLYMGNLDSLRDWGHAKDYVRMQWMMLQQEQAKDYVIATGVQYSVRQFIDMAAKELGITLAFEGDGVEERAVVLKVEGDKATAVAASDDLAQAERVQQVFSTQWFRVYTNPDVIGVELAGATKNIIAIAAGILDGLAAGNNAKAALVTRGLVEITRLGVAMGAHESTFHGLAGLGDLITTCVSPEGRNRTVGEQIGKGRKLEEILEHMDSIAEGVPTTRSVHELAARHRVEMPITQAVHSVLFEGKDVIAALSDLMPRGPKPERQPASHVR